MSITPKLDKPLESMTQLDKERAIKRLRGEEEALLEEMGQETEAKAIPTVQEYVKEQDEAERQRHWRDQEALKFYSKDKKKYQRYLLNVIERFINEESLPKKYTLEAESNDDGIVVKLEGTEYYGAFKVSGIPIYDINACKIIAVQVGNTVAKLEGHYTTTDSGIFVLRGAEAELAMREVKKKWTQRKT